MLLLLRTSNRVFSPPTLVKRVVPKGPAESNSMFQLLQITESQMGLKKMSRRVKRVKRKYPILDFVPKKNTLSSLERRMIEKEVQPVAICTRARRSQPGHLCPAEPSQATEPCWPNFTRALQLCTELY